MIKKSLLLLTCMLLALSLVACTGQDISGNYKLTSATANGQNSEDIAAGIAVLQAFGMSVDLKLYKDGTGKITVIGQEWKLEYNKSKKTITFTDGGNDKATPYTYMEGTLTLTTDGGTLVFEKQPD